MEWLYAHLKSVQICLDDLVVCTDDWTHPALYIAFWGLLFVVWAVWTWREGNKLADDVDTLIRLCLNNRNRQEAIQPWDKQADILWVFEVAAQYSGGRLFLARDEAADSEECGEDDPHFLKLDGRRFSHNIGFYSFIGRVMGWEEALDMILQNVLVPLCGLLPESYARAEEAFRTLSESVQEDWLSRTGEPFSRKQGE